MPKDKYGWTRSGAGTTWTSRTITRGPAGGTTDYTGVITYDGTDYNLDVNSGAHTGAFDTLRNAKNDFRKYLADK